MASIFEELMTKFSDDHANKEKCARKINCKNLKVESRQYFEENSLDDLEKQFVISDVETPDEVVLVIDPEVQNSEELPEDAAEEMVGDQVYKCPVCGSNYVCDEETEAVDLDEFGVPIVCPICGDDADQILVGEIAPADDAPRKEVDMPLQDNDEEAPEEEEVVDIDDTEEVIEEDLGVDLAKYQKWVDYDMKRYGRISDKTNDLIKKAGLQVIKDQYGDYEVTAGSYKAEAKKIKEDVEVKLTDEGELSVKVDPDKTDVEDEVVEVTPPEEEIIDTTEEEEVIEEDLGTDIAKYQKWVDYDMKRYGRISDKTNKLIKDAGLELVKDQYGDYEVITGKDECYSVKESKVCKDESIDDDNFMELDVEEEKEEEVKEEPKVYVKDSEVDLIFDDVRFERMMNKLLGENYKNHPRFLTRRVSSKDNTLRVEYFVRSNQKTKKGILIGEGFDASKNVLKVSFRDQGVFTESTKSKNPMMVVEFVRLKDRVIPTKMAYNYKVKVNESYYRVKGQIIR